MMYDCLRGATDWPKRLSDDTKMENLILDLDGDGEVSVEEFMAVLMKDNFWTAHAEADEALLHPLTPMGKG